MCEKEKAKRNNLQSNKTLQKMEFITQSNKFPIRHWQNSKDPFEAKFHFNYSKAFIEYSNDLNDIYESIEKWNPNKNRKILIVFDDMIADMLSIKKRKKCNNNWIIY